MIICPKNDRGVMSPYPTVVIAIKGINNLYLRGEEGVQLTDENKPSSRGDGLFSCESISSEGHQRRSYGELTWFTMGVQEYFDRGVPSSSLDEVSETGEVNRHRTKIGGSAYRRVLNTTSTMTTKKLSARSACCDLLKERNITSIVLQGSRSVTSLQHIAGTHLQEDCIIVSEWSEHP